jgi:hypothetical protein
MRTGSAAASPQSSTVEESQRKAAKAAGLAFLISFALLAYGEFGIRRSLVSGDPILGLVNAAETSRNILAQPLLFRLNIVLILSWCVGMTVVLAAFYVILRPFGRTIALVAAVSQVLFAGAWAIGAARLLETLRLLNGIGELRTFTEDQLQALASLPLSIFWDHYYIGLLFWAVSTTLFSYLWLKSRHIPRALAVFGIVSGALATLTALSAFAFIADPAFSNDANPWWLSLDTPLAIFQIALSVLLLVKPLRPPPSPATPRPSRSLVGLPNLRRPQHAATQDARKNRGTAIPARRAARRVRHRGALRRGRAGRCCGHDREHPRLGDAVSARVRPPAQRSRRLHTP